MSKYQFSQQTAAAECPITECPALDPIASFRRDPTGYYVLIRIDRPAGRIELALCDKGHVIRRVFTGRAGADIYHAVLRCERSGGVEWFREKTHLAYLGKELARAEAALACPDAEYVQE